MSGPMAPIPESGRAVARAAADAFGGAPRVLRHPDPTGGLYIDVMTTADRPTAGYETHTTLGLMFVPNSLDGQDVRVELAGVSEGADSAYPFMLADAAFHVLRDHWLAAPGVTFPGLVRDHYPRGEMHHLILVPPFPWPELGTVAVADNLEVHWLLAMPISDSERDFVAKRGFDEFERLLESNDVEYWRTDRPPVA